MTHLFIVVLVEKDARRDIEESVSELLAPYDEQLKVAEHEEDCPCVGLAARRRAYEAMRSRFGTTETREAQGFGKETFESDSEKSLPRPNCTLCAGTGKWRTTLNPDGRWDWWSFGGRWDSAIQNDFSKTNPYKISHTHRLNCNISIPRRLIDHNIIPAAIVTPDGCWHEEEDWKNWTWEDTVRSIFSKNLDALAVGIDCHA